MKMENRTYWIIGAIVLAIVLLPYLKLEKFAIVESDFVYIDEKVAHANAAEDSVTIADGKINFSLSGKAYSFPSGKIYYILDNKSDVLYDDIPSIPINVSANHIVSKYQVTSINGDTEARFQWWIAAIKIEVKNVYMNVTSQQLCIGVGGVYSGTTCTCQDKTKWYDNSTLKVCPPVTVEKEVKVPVEQTFTEKYGLTLVVIAIAAGVILYMRRKK